MRVFVCIVTPDASLTRLIGTRDGLVIPREAAQRGYFGRQSARFSAMAWTPTPEDLSSAGFEKYLLGRIAHADAAILIVDEAWLHFVSDIRNAAFVVTFGPAEVGKSAKNFLQSLAARSLRAFGQMLAKFDRADDGKLLTLPLRNFDAAELREIARLCREENLVATFSDHVEAQLVGLRRRERPRRRSKYSTVYAVDDLKRFFVYGHERHSRFSTGNPHTSACEIAGRIRFGRVIDADRHYNVSETEGDKTKISGDFSDCHDVSYSIRKNTTHLNMFANDYFGYEKREER